MVVLVTSNNEEDPMENKGATVATTFSHSKSMGIFSKHSRAANSAI